MDVGFVGESVAALLDAALAGGDLGFGDGEPDAGEEVGEG